MRSAGILYDVPNVAYGTYGCTPFPMCLKACADYLGNPVTYTQTMAESGAAFRLTWNTEEWDGGNVDVIFAYDKPDKVYQNGLRSIGSDFKMLGRAPETKKEDFMAFIRKEVDKGNPVIALGIIGPPEACIVAGYRDNGEELLGWNFFQEYPEYQAKVKIEKNGYFSTRTWWENPDSCALFSTGMDGVASFSEKEVLSNIIEVMSGRICGPYAKGIYAYDAWKNALLCEQNFPPNAILPVLVERMMCHGDAMDCISDGRYHGAQYLRGMAAKFRESAEKIAVGESYEAAGGEKSGLEAASKLAQKLEAAAKELDGESNVLCRKMVSALGGWGRSEAQVRKLAELRTRSLFAGQIDEMKGHEERALVLLREAFELLE